MSICAGVSALVTDFVQLFFRLKPIREIESVYPSTLDINPARPLLNLL
jgi:hypothetical protein